MLYFIACASIAAYMAYWLRPRLLKLPLLAVPGGMVSGLVIGSVLVFGVLSISGAAMVQSEIPRAFGQAFWWSLIAAGAGYVAAKASSASDKWMNAGAVALVAVLVLALAASVSNTSQTAAEVQSTPATVIQSTPVQQLPKVDRYGKPCTEISEFLKECTR